MPHTKLFTETFSKNYSMAIDTHKLRYLIDGIDIREAYGVVISKSNGLLSRPKTKTPPKTDWKDYHGEVVDLSATRKEPRTITLKGWMPADNKGDLAAKWNAFMRIFDKPGTRRLTVDIHPTHPLVYEVYLADETDIEKQWSYRDMAGTFTLKLREPEPVKRVIRQIVTSENTRTLRIQMRTLKSVTISWGDGKYDNDVSGMVDITHTYPANPEGIARRDYIAVISGVIEEITMFTTNGTVLWNIL